MLNMNPTDCNDCLMMLLACRRGNNFQNHSIIMSRP